MTFTTQLHVLLMYEQQHGRLRQWDIYAEMSVVNVTVKVRELEYEGAIKKYEFKFT